MVMAPFGAIALFADASTSGAQDMVVASPNSPAQLHLDVPVAQATGSNTVLDLSIQSVQAPNAASLGGIVSVTSPGSGQAIEVGRFSLYPAGSWTSSSDDQRTFRFDLTSALRRVVSPAAGVTVSVDLIDRLHGGAPHGAKLTIGDAQIVQRKP